MSFYLLIIGIVMVIFGYIVIFISYFKYHKFKNNDIICFDVIKDMTSSYDNINVIEATDNIFSKYYFKRRLIKLSKNMYEARDDFSFAVGSYLSGLSLSYSKYCRWISYIFPSIGFINKSSIIMAVISLFLYSKGDAKIGLVIGGLVLVYQYLYLQIFSSILEITDKRLKYDKDIVIKILSKVYSVNVLFFISTLVFMINFIFILI